VLPEQVQAVVFLPKDGFDSGYDFVFDGRRFLSE
jgi:hypothetical protein